MNKALLNKTILVANSTSQIAADIIQKCSMSGAEVVACSRQKKSSMSITFDNVRNYSCLNTDETIKKFIDQECPKIDGVVLSIGEVDLRPLKNVTEQYVESLFRAHVAIPVCIISSLLKARKINHRCSIVFISSINGVIVSSSGGSIYGMLKSAVSGFSKGLAKELSYLDGRSNCICPGVVETSSLYNEFSEEEIIKMKSNNLTHSLVTKTDIAELTVFLLSEKSKNISGTNIILDGGFSII